MLLPFLALDFLLSVMTDSIKAIHALLADEFLSKKIAIGIVNILENVEGRLAARFGRNLPMADSDLVVPRIVFGFPDVVAGDSTTSRCAYSAKQSGLLLIDGYSVALVVDIPNSQC